MSSLCFLLFVTYQTVIAKYSGKFGIDLHAVFVDFQRAFPSVNRTLLLNHLANIGMSHSMVRIMASMLSNNAFRLKTCDRFSPKGFVTEGVREGGVLSPLLFVLYISDLGPSVFQPSSFAIPSLDGTSRDEFALYADDIIFFALSKPAAQHRLDLLHVYCLRKKLNVNVRKTEIMVFRKRAATPVLRSGCFYGTDELPVTSKFKYLGYWLTDIMDESVHLGERLAKAKIAADSLCTFAKKFDIFKPALVAELYRTLVSSQYFAFEFCHINTRALNVVKRAFLKKLLGMPNGTLSAFLHLLFFDVYDADRDLFLKLGFYARQSDGPPGS